MLQTYANIMSVSDVSLLVRLFVVRALSLSLLTRCFSRLRLISTSLGDIRTAQATSSNPPKPVRLQKFEFVALKSKHGPHLIDTS